MGQFLGFVTLGQDLSGSHLTKNTSNTPLDSSPAPQYRLYGPNGLMTNGTGSLSIKDPGAAGGAITGASNAAPIQITSAAHGLTTGTRVTIASVGGNTGANGDFNVTSIDANNFTLQGSTGNGAYTSGGTWHTTGLYDVDIDILGANGFAQGQCYTLFVTSVVGGVTMGDVYSFVCV